MSDDDVVIQLKRRIAAIARGQIGAHYVWGGYGNAPGIAADAHRFPGGFGNRVRMWPNDPRGNVRDHRRSQPIMYTAFTQIGGRIYICGGRCNRVSAVPHATISDENVQAVRVVYLWPRPDGAIDSRRTVWGEPCDGVRHFDCVGLVNWCYWRVTSRNIQYSISQWRSLATRRIAISDAGPGDILAASHAGGEGNTSEHIGIACGRGRVVHARSYRIGVEETLIEGGGTRWNYAGRPIPRVFRSA